MEQEGGSEDEQFTCANCGVTKDQTFVVCPDCEASFTETGVSGTEAEQKAKENETTELE